MRDFRSHLDDFESRGKGCSPFSGPKTIVSTHTRGLEIDDMMKAKFSRTWRLSLMAWVLFMALLCLAYIYAANTNWDDSWFRTPTKYNISALLEGDMDDDMTIDPGKTLDVVNDEDTPAKKAKTTKENKVADNGNDEEPAVEDETPSEGDEKPKAAKAPKE